MPGIDFATGSLGHGLSLATGAALAGRLRELERRAFCCSATPSATRDRSGRPSCSPPTTGCRISSPIVDLNGQQALGYTKDVLDLSPMAERWRAFGWDVHEVDGHDRGALAERHRGARRAAGPPHVLVAHTVFGKGVSFMERSIEWHYLPMAEGQYAVRCELGGRCRRSRREGDLRPDARRARGGGRAHRAADRRPRLHGRRAVRRAVPGPLLQRRRRRAEHGRRRDRPRRGRGSSRSSTRSRRSRLSARTSSSATAPCCTISRCGSSASAAASSTG